MSSHGYPVARNISIKLTKCKGGRYQRYRTVPSSLTKRVTRVLRYGRNQIDNFLSPDGSYVLRKLTDMLEL